MTDIFPGQLTDFVCSGLGAITGGGVASSSSSSSETVATAGVSDTVLEFCGATDGPERGSGRVEVVAVVVVTSTIVPTA